MEKIEKYRQAIREILNKEAATTPSNLPNVENQIIFDAANNHYLLLEVGWQGDEMVHSCVLHFDIRAQKIWIQQDLTERGIAHDLMEKGIAKSEIVLAYHAPYRRASAGFAVA